MRQTIILLFGLFCLNGTYAQALSQRLIEEGRGYLNGWYYQGTPEDAKKSFKKAKFLFFYKKSVVNDAKLGLSEYYLVVKDTLKSIRILRTIIGKKRCRKIEKSEFYKLKETNQDDWDVYYSTMHIIKIALEQKKFALAKNYLKYFNEYVKVKWNCGSGSAGQKKFIEDTEITLKENGY